MAARRLPCPFPRTASSFSRSDVLLGAFVILAVLVVGSAAGLILKRNPIHGALFLVINLASVAGL